MYKILMVEDDATITEVLRRQLTKWGYLVQIAADFGRVLEQFETFEPHLVLLDISLPFFNGYHWCTEIRKISQTPVIFISSAEDTMNLVMAINLGADDFVAKPFNLEALPSQTDLLEAGYLDMIQVLHARCLLIGEKAEQDLANANHYTLILEDSGIGIQPEDLPRVFEWGYTGYNGRLDKRSTGIGLSLCKQVLCLLGHEISLTSVVGKGPTVRLVLSREKFDVE